MPFPHIGARRLRRSADVVIGAALLLTAIAHAARAQGGPPRTAEIFRRYADRTVRIEVVERGSGAKASLGTGFHVDVEGRVVTNYHVVSKLVTHGERYHAQATRQRGAPVRLTLVAVDVVNDLAVLRAAEPAAAYFTLDTIAPAKGDRLFALGHPRDLGLSIVDGTYNGHLEHTLYPKIHFTGALNPGMSGGPALDERGTVVGVNVSTEGNEISYLVPVAHVAALVARVRQPGFTPPSDFLAEVADQLRRYQDEYLTGLFTAGSDSTVIGAFTLPTRPAPFFKCWADAEHDEQRPYDIVHHRCSTDDYIFLSDEQSAGVIELQHRVLTTTSLNALQFAALYSSELESDRSPLWGSETTVTRFECVTRNVRHDGRLLRAQLCLRAYRKLPGLYDAVLRAAALGTARTGVVTTLTLSGVSAENVRRLSRRYLESITWRR